MTIVPLTLAELRQALLDGWAMARMTRSISTAFAGIFVLLGTLILGSLLALGLTPFVIAAAGAFMLVGPIVLAGFFGIARAYEAGEPPGSASIVAGFAGAARALWALALVCALLFMIFVTDAAILYSYMVGGTPIFPGAGLSTIPGVTNFVLAGMFSGFVLALILFCVSAFSVPLLCERRAGLVDAVVCSVRVVFGSFMPLMAWAALLGSVIVGSILLLPLLLLTLPWLAYASRALYRQALPLTPD